MIGKDIDKDSMYILTLYTDDIIPTFNPMHYVDDFESNSNAFS